MEVSNILSGITIEINVYFDYFLDKKGNLAMNFNNYFFISRWPNLIC